MFAPSDGLLRELHLNRLSDPLFQYLERKLVRCLSGMHFQSVRFEGNP